MKTKYNELFIGLSVTVVLFIIIGGIMWLERSNFLEHGLNLNLVVENAKGVQVSDYILYKGLNVGTVQSTELSKKGIVVKLKITKVDTIPIDSKFEIKEINVLGEKGVEITPGYSRTYLKNGAFVYGTSSGGITALLDSGKILTNHLNKIFTNIDSLSNKRTARKVRTTLIKLDESVGLMHRLLKENLGDIHQTIQNIKKISTDNQAPIDSLINRLSRQSVNLSYTIENTKKLTDNLNSLLSKVNKGQGTIGKLITDDSLYNNLNFTLIHLDSLIQAIRKNPTRFFKIKIL